MSESGTTFIEIEYGSNTYREECELRHAVLRAPLGLSLYDEDLAGEREQLHFGLTDGAVLVACVIAVAVSPDEVKIRQMAVRHGCQRRGYGRGIMQCLEAHLSARGFTRFSMHARLSAAGFYEQLGFSKIGGEFIEVGIPHIRMEKHRPAVEAWQAHGGWPV